MDKLPRAFTTLACAALLQAFAPGPPPLRQPIRGWVLDYGDTACTAMRTYGSAAAPVLLAFRPSPNGGVVRLVVSRPGKAPPAYHFPLTTNISADSARATGLRFPSADRKNDIVWINFARPDLEALRGAGEIAIRGGGAIDQRFALPGIAAVLDALDICNADLRKYWNVGDAGVQLSAPARSLRPLAAYFSSDDYPAQAISEEATGTSRIVVMVDETGAVKDCLVEETSGIASLDAMACIALRQRARFKPALDAAGKPVRSVLTGRVTWRMP